MKQIKMWVRRHTVAVLIILACALSVIVSAYKYRSGEINYYNSDATWHVLCTIEAYNETPASEHLFLPLVSLGTEQNKYIPWGACVQGKDGNYYYTSFSMVGYFLPWLFMKLFSLPVSEGSLYLFNSLLFAVSAALWTWFIYMVYADGKAGDGNAVFLAVIAAFTYIFSPELLHGMGIVYWHQSVMQVTLSAQIIAYYKMMRNGSRKAMAAFFMFVLLNPYLEWTGYVANAGFALAEIMRYWKKNRASGLTRAYAVGAFSLVSFGIFVLHYLLRVDAGVFFASLKERFAVRSTNVAVFMTDVFGGYLKSFLYLWVLFLILVIWNFVRSKRVVMEKGILIFVLAFPLVENIVMKQHALSYTYDRMKCIFLLSFLICELAAGLLDGAPQKHSVMIGVLAAAVICCGLNLRAYQNDTARIWEVDYREDNQRLADYINENYGDSIMLTEQAGTVRGYLNLLFGRGIYEGISVEQGRQAAMTQGRRYVVAIDVDMQTEPWNWNLCPVRGAAVYDVNTGSWDIFHVVDGQIWAENGGQL